MKLINYLLLLNFITGYSYAQPASPSCIANDEKINHEYSKAKELNTILEEVVKHGVPGVSIAVHSPQGWWQASAGFAKLETQTAMEPCHLLFLQSISKTYMAVAILRLYEQGKINLDEPITKYLSPQLSAHITTAEKITVKMLLNHTSGIPEYNLQPKYITYLLQHPRHYFAPEDYLKYIHQKPLDFAPGSNYSYRNTNYLLLALIGDAITGDHANFIRKNIFKPLEVTQTFYRGDSGYLNYPSLVNSYWDRHSNGIVENASELQNHNVVSLIGDDGIVTTPLEAVTFLKGLIEGKLLSITTLELMKSWVNDRKGNPTYGLGLDHAAFAGHKAYGHSGGGIGAGCQLYFFPEKNVYVFLGINLGTVTDSPLHIEMTKAIDQLYEVILR
jgi:D-alanyl-D-alanine carboxypeptidase